MNRLYPLPRWRPQLGAEPMNISINAKLSVEREPVIGQTLIDMRGRKPAWEGILANQKYTFADSAHTRVTGDEPIKSPRSQRLAIFTLNTDYGIDIGSTGVDT